MSNAPELPKPQQLTQAVSALDRSRNCPKCGREARIVANISGFQAFCGPCKYDWPIGGSPVRVDMGTVGRGTSKQTLVEPDWDKLR